MERVAGPEAAVSDVLQETGVVERQCRADRGLEGFNLVGCQSTAQLDASAHARSELLIEAYSSCGGQPEKAGEA
jgi:hypothetical protein